MCSYIHVHVYKCIYVAIADFESTAHTVQAFYPTSEETVLGIYRWFSLTSTCICTVSIVLHMYMYVTLTCLANDIFSIINVIKGEVLYWKEELNPFLLQDLSTSFADSESRGVRRDRQELITSAEEKKQRREEENRSIHAEKRVWWGTCMYIVCTSIKREYAKNTNVDETRKIPIPCTCMHVQWVLIKDSCFHSVM